MVYHNLASLCLRIGFGGMMITHGWDKCKRMLEGNMSFADPLGIGEETTLILAVISEFICPILIVLGLKTRLASVLPAMTMLVAAFVVHGSDPWAKKEFALLYLCGFIGLFLLGSGKYSMDFRLRRV